MNYFKNKIVKYLKKMGVFKVFNFNFIVNIDKKRIIIPFVQNIGYANITLKRTWLHELTNFYCSKNELTFIDIGANVGQTLIGIKTINPQIPYLGFEPSVACSFYLKELIKKNQFENTTIQNVALSNKIGNLILEKDYEDDPRASVVKELRPNYFSNKELVFSIDFDSLDYSQKIGLVKIDVEGAEYEVLLGMTKMITKNRPIIVCEVLDSHSKEVLSYTQGRASLVSEFLKKHNYGIIQLEQNKKCDKINSFNEKEAIFIEQYNSESIYFNDYIFYPNENSKEIYEFLNSVKNN